MAVRQLLKLILLSSAIPIFAYTEIVAQNTRLLDQEPAVEWLSSAPSDPQRQAKSTRYDRWSLGLIRETPFNVEELPVNVHWWKGIPSLPIAESDAVMVGYVLDAKAFLSNNRSVVYSEFSVRIDQVLKDSSPAPVKAEGTLVAQRLGGAVIFPSGKVQHYRISQQGFPQVNEQYILFLKFNGADYDIVTGYRIAGGEVRPLDQGSNLPFRKYDGKTVNDFLTELRARISTWKYRTPAGHFFWPAQCFTFTDESQPEAASLDGNSFRLQSSGKPIA